MRAIRITICLMMSLSLFITLFPVGEVQGELEADFSVHAQRKTQLAPYLWEVYEEEDISFIGSGENAEEFNWSFGDGEEISKETNSVSHIYQHTGTYNVTLTVHDSENNSDSISGKLVVVERPGAILKVTDIYGNSLAPNYSIEKGDRIVLDGSGSKGNIQTYVFEHNLHTAFLPQAQFSNPTYERTFNEAGTFKVALRVVDRLGNKSEMDPEEFIEITVQDSSDTDGGREIDDQLYLKIGIGAIIILAIFAMVLQNNLQKGWG